LTGNTQVSHNRARVHFLAAMISRDGRMLVEPSARRTAKCRSGKNGYITGHSICQVVHRPLCTVCAQAAALASRRPGFPPSAPTVRRDGQSPTPRSKQAGTVFSVALAPAATGEEGRAQATTCGNSLGTPPRKNPLPGRTNALRRTGCMKLGRYTTGGSRACWWWCSTSS
jgi:hypothetical protein